MEVKILFNYDDELYCSFCKCKIEIGEKFGIVYDEDIDGKFEKTFHIECLPEVEEEPYISPEE